MFGLYGEQAERLTSSVLGGDDDGDRGDGEEIVVGTLNDDDVGINNFCLLLGEVLDLSSSKERRRRRRLRLEEYEL